MTWSDIAIPPRGLRVRRALGMAPDNNAPTDKRRRCNPTANPASEVRPKIMANPCSQPFKNFPVLSVWIQGHTNTIYVLTHKWSVQKYDTDADVVFLVFVREEDVLNQHGRRSEIQRIPAKRSKKVFTLVALLSSKNRTQPNEPIPSSFLYRVDHN